MKKTIIALLFPISVFAQTNIDDTIIVLCTHPATGKNYAFLNQTLKCSGNSGRTITITPSFGVENGSVKPNGFLVKTDNFGGCNEGDEIYFMFSDGTKLKYSSWNDFNCKNVSYFDYEGKALSDFFDKEVWGIYYLSGRSKNSMSYFFTASEKRFFINVRNAYINRRFVEKDCEF